MAPPTKLSALVVDDEPSLVRVVEGYLLQDGFDVRTAGDGESALALARESEPDLVVLDLGLPGMDGIEVCRELRTFSRCYILMLTARADEVDMLIGLGRRRRRLRDQTVLSTHPDGPHPHPAPTAPHRGSPPDGAGRNRSSASSVIS